MAAGTDPIAPLTNSQKLFLQRLLIAHVLADQDAKQLYQSIKEGFADVAPVDDEGEEEEGEGRNGGDQGYMGNDFEHCLGIINASLVPAFNLEVGTVSLPPPYDEDGDDDGGRPSSSSSRSPGSRKRPHLVKYHAVVNRSNDAVAKAHAFPLVRGGPHEMAYFRLVLERIVERGAEMLEEGSDGAAASAAGAGCPGSLSRMELINLRTEMDGNHRDKLTIRQTEKALEVLEEEGWLARAAPPAEDDSEHEDQEEEESDDEKEEEGRRQRRKRKGRPSSSGKSRRKSLRGTFYGVGPRSFMELGEFLQKAGLPGDRMPQSILHRI
mmetsp:Transcript_10554/g.22886  ORF Transcript_10554/g.22886 Transcript_10554/m.22886 type:complete len:324 (+) Transcript_10554:83-1054(+)